MENTMSGQRRALNERLRNWGLLNAREVADLLCVHLRTVYRLLERGQLPQPIRFGRKIVRWRAEDLRRRLTGGAGAEEDAEMKEV
jgi:excisionase family DNA binding protein